MQVYGGQGGESFSWGVSGTVGKNSGDVRVARYADGSVNVISETEYQGFVASGVGVEPNQSELFACPDCENWLDWYNWLTENPAEQARIKESLKDTGTGILKGGLQNLIDTGNLQMNVEVNTSEKFGFGLGIFFSALLEPGPGGEVKLATKTSISTFKSIGAAGRSWKNVKMLSNNLLKKKGIDAHALKRDFLGKKVKISQFDLYKHTDTGEVLIFKKGGVGQPIFTGEFIN